MFANNDSDDQAPSDRLGESSTGKRRLSLRVGRTASPAKKARSSQDGPDRQSPKGGREDGVGVGGRDRLDPEHDNGTFQRQDLAQLPSTAESFTRSSSRSSPSVSPSPSSNPSENDPTPVSKSTSSHTAISGRSSKRHFPSPPLDSASTSTSRPSMPTWSTAPSSESDQPGQSIPEARASSQHHQLSTSAPSRLPSPPPSFNLSTGQPLVNPPLKTQAAFVGKLYAMLEDEQIINTGLIHWSADGTIFTCPNPTEFSRIVLPRFFKHNNWQSFVRQLNMYSFNKVNDLFATTSDPGAWEFRHPLFRRGEPHLLASIKRKTTRPSNAEGQPLHSPTDDLDGHKPVAGWMRDASQASFRVSPPPLARDYIPPPAASRPRGYGYNMPTGEGVSHRTSEERRPDSGGMVWETTSQPPSSARMPPPPPEASGPRYHPDPGRPPLSTHRHGLAGPPGYPESPYYPQPQNSPIDALSNQVATLEDKVQRLNEVLNFERIENVRSNLDFASYLLQLTGWVGDREVPAQPDMRALKETLNRATAEFRQKYETLMASDALASLASGERRPRVTLEPPPSFTTLGPPPPRNPSASTLPDFRRPHAGGRTPRTSPRTATFPDIPHRHLPPPSETSTAGNASQRTQGLPDNRRYHFIDEIPARGTPPASTSTGRPGSIEPRSRPNKEEDETMEEAKPRTAVSSLLN